MRLIITVATLVLTISTTGCALTPEQRAWYEERGRMPYQQAQASTTMRWRDYNEFAADRRKEEQVAERQQQKIDQQTVSRSTRRNGLRN